MDAERMAEALVTRVDDELSVAGRFFDRWEDDVDAAAMLEVWRQDIAAALAELLQARDRAALGEEAPLTADDLVGLRRGTSSRAEGFHVSRQTAGRMLDHVDYLQRLLTAFRAESDYFEGYEAGRRAGLEEAAKALVGWPGDAYLAKAQR